MSDDAPADVAPAVDEPSAQVATTLGLIELTELTEIRFYELFAASDDELTPNGAEPEPDESGEQTIAVRTAIRKRPDAVDYRVEVEVQRFGRTMRADAAAMYSAPGPFEAAPDVLYDFGDNVAMMAVYPYLRQAISDLAQRLGDQVVLPILSRGAVSFRGPEADADSDHAAGADATPDRQEAVERE